jgi:hypothetical protein
MRELLILEAGDPGKLAPLTLAIVANPFLLDEIDNTLSQDPILQAKAAFEQSARYIADNILGNVPGQAENLFGTSQLFGKLQVIRFFADDLALSAANALVRLDDGSNILIPSAPAIKNFTAQNGFQADIVAVVSASLTHTRASAVPATDGPPLGGVPFNLDGTVYHHVHRSQNPGCFAIHVTRRSMTPLHEFQHALSSYDNGAILDLYLDWFPAGGVVINKRQRTTANTNTHFATYAGKQYLSSPNRGPIPYPAAWKCIHPELHNPGRYSLMDNFPADSNPLACENDKITRAFLVDRLIARMNR